MERIAWKRLSRQWPVIFCAAVATWFVISALGVPDRIRTLRTDETTPTAEAAPANVNGSLRVGVRSFYLENDSDSPTRLSAKLTLEVVNGSSSNQEFRPGQLTMQRSGGQSQSPADIRTGTIQVAPSVPVLTTVTFPAEAARGGRYSIAYAGKTVYEGLPG